MVRKDGRLCTDASETVCMPSCSVTSDSLSLWGYSLPGSSVRKILQARILEVSRRSFLQGIFPTGIKSTSLTFPALASGFLERLHSRIIIKENLPAEGFLCVFHQFSSHFLFCYGQVKLLQNYIMLKL